MKPHRIILVRHGESQANVDKSVYDNTPDHEVRLTEKGEAQAFSAAVKIEKMLPVHAEVQVYTSPYKRAYQTLGQIEFGLGPKRRLMVREEPRLREQEWSPLIASWLGRPVCDVIDEYRRQYGKFYFRIPGGESGADVYDRVTTFLDTMYRDFDRPDFPTNVLIVTHGLTLRLLLMRWFHWTVEYFERTRNPDNCEVFVVELDKDEKYKLLTELKLREPKPSSD